MKIDFILLTVVVLFLASQLDAKIEKKFSKSQESKKEAKKYTFSHKREKKFSDFQEFQQEESQLVRKDNLGSLVSTGKPSSQSSDFIWGTQTIESIYANDGKYGQNWNNPSLCSHTQPLLNSWWQVDLLGQYTMTQVKLWNRADCCPQRLLPVKILVSTDGASWTQCGYLDGTGAAGAIYTIPCTGSGRYVRVQLDKTDYLTLCEVEVWGSPKCAAPAPKPQPKPDYTP
jgi:hypothetical protein